MLTLCPKCRHFHRPAEASCPFCGARRLVTAAVVGAAVALGTAGCSEKPTRSVPVPLYGAVPRVLVVTADGGAPVAAGPGTAAEPAPAAELDAGVQAPPREMVPRPLYGKPAPAPRPGKP